MNNRHSISENYGVFLDSYLNIKKENIENYTDRKISIEIYYQVFKIHYYAGRYSKRFNRGVKHSTADVFQDIIAYYLKVFLNSDYDVVLETAKGKCRPDILIKKNGKNHFVIEIKTSIGWNRKSIVDGTIKNRIKKLSEVFDVNKNKIIFIFETHGNVNKEFSERYWDKIEAKPNKRPVVFPYNQIYPLFNSSDPYYMLNEFDRNDLYERTIGDKKIAELAKKNIVTGFEKIIKLIESDGSC